MSNAREETTERRATGTLAPDPEMWSAFEEGALLRTILETFYGRVYEDARLGHFFEGTTQERAIEKQYSFLKSIFTGERCYFGFRPRNGHNWMVISDELFDYREDLLAACLREYGLAEHLVERVREVDEVFRKQIVKAAPFPRKMGGAEMPLDGFETIAIAGGTICDECEEGIDDGVVATFHRRTGKTFCAICHPPRTQEEEAPHD